MPDIVGATTLESGQMVWPGAIDIAIEGDRRVVMDNCEINRHVLEGRLADAA